jgi:hypothetical protein
MEGNVPEVTLTSSPSFNSAEMRKVRGSQGRERASIRFGL